MNDTQTAVVTDAKKDKMVTYYLIAVGSAGLGLVIASIVLGWGGYAIGGGAFLMLAGFGGLGGKIAQGGFAEAPCPSCTAPLKFQFSKVERIMQCESCGAWSEGKETMALVPDDRVAARPVFQTPKPEGGVVWPRNAAGAVACPMCDVASTGMEKIEGGDALGLTAAMAAPVSVRRVYSIEVPICPNHKDGIALFVSGTKLSLGFRARAYQKRFEAANA